MYVFDMFYCITCMNKDDDDDYDDDDDGWIPPIRGNSPRVQSKYCIHGLL